MDEHDHSLGTQAKGTEPRPRAGRGMGRGSSSRESYSKAGSLGLPAEAYIGLGHLRSRKIFTGQGCLDGSVC